MLAATCKKGVKKVIKFYTGTTTFLLLFPLFIRLEESIYTHEFEHNLLVPIVDQLLQDLCYLVCMELT